MEATDDELRGVWFVGASAEVHTETDEAITEFRIIGDLYIYSHRT